MIDETAFGTGVERSRYSTEAVDLKAKLAGVQAFLAYNPCSICMRAYPDKTEKTTTSVAPLPKRDICHILHLPLP